VEEVLTVPLLDSHAGDDEIDEEWEQLQVSMLKMLAILDIFCCIDVTVCGLQYSF